MNRRDVLKSLTFAATAFGILGSITKKETHLKYRLGKQPARPHDGLKLRDYITPKKLPAPPENFGHETLVSDWLMLGNDMAGDCGIAGPFHGEMLWCAEGQRQINVNTKCVLEAYGEIAGYNPDAWDPYTQTNPTDKGSDIQKVAEYWRTTGLKDADGKIHKIDAYLSLEPKNVEQLFHALYLFDGVGIGIECPEEYQQAFTRGQVWDSIAKPHIEGGHYILGVGSRAGLINTVTWGRTQLMTPAGYRQFNDETYVYLNEEKLINGKDIDGFDLKQLVADMADLASESVIYEPRRAA